MKVDLEKACDCLEWKFIEDSLRVVGIPESLETVIMKLIATGSCRLLWDGEATNIIRPSRGLRWADPCSRIYLYCVWKY